MEHKMPRLPYAHNALAPRMSEETFEYHFDRHVQTYVDNLNRLVVNTPYADMPVEEIICKASGPIFNNAAQVWNHTFFFETLSPTPHPMTSVLKELILQQYGSVDAFKEQLLNTAVGIFGSGWAWLSINDRCELIISGESNAGNPLTKELTPLLTIDVWEHAYYIDYRNKRADYAKAVWELIDWNKVEERMQRSSCNIYI